MEEDGSGSEFHDWEVLHDYEYDHTFPQVHSNFPDSNSRFFHVIEGDSGSRTTIWFDYFSLRDHQNDAKTSLESTVNDACLVELENLNSNDTDSENRNSRRSTSELGSESGDGLLDDQSHANGFADITKSVTGFEEIATDVENLERRESDDGKFSGSAFVARDEPLSAKDLCSPMESEGSGEEIESQDEVLDSNSIGNESVSLKFGDCGKESDHIDSVNDVLNRDLGGEDGESSEKIDVGTEEVKVEAKSGEIDAQRRRVVWWKVPFQVLRYFFLKASPAWSFSVAVAFMGMVILGRRLYKMKRKTTSLQLKIAVDDKKISQFADRAARLNEAFSMVRRVPEVRASWTGAGANSWPAMSMR
ncbi:hypothetical protein SDJN02_07470 [Cucurbita argyrosperma subsp. argyrosperma]|nr:hypothetical protein SDJN02_07470 [Cucurbita argyrosperma subsp. argyrosperma]